MNLKKRTLKTAFLFLLVLAAALFFRISHLSLIEFKADEATNLFLASRPLFGHPFPPGGTISSVGILNFPLFNYILFPLAAISTNPKTITFFIGLINSLAVAFLFLILKRYYGTIISLITSMLAALSPWAILFSRKIWPQNLIFPLITILIFALHHIFINQRRRFWVIYIFVSLLIIQLHQGSIFFLILLSLFAFMKSRPPLRLLIISFILGIAPTIPFFQHSLKNLFSYPQAIFIPKEKISNMFYPEIFLRPLQIASQGNFYFILGTDTLTFQKDFPLIYQLRKIFYLEYLLIPLGMLFFWQQYRRLRFLVLAVGSLPIAYFLLRFVPHIHYFIVIVPFVFLFLGISLSRFVNSSKPVFKIAGIGLSIILLLNSFVYNTAFFKLVKKQGGLKGDYGSIFALSEKTIKEGIAPYRGDSHYQEMFLASFLPKRDWYGFLPLSRMIYSYQDTQKRLTKLEKRLNSVPEDTRVQNELLAFYTWTPPTLEILDLLKQKSNTIPGYQPIHNEVKHLLPKP